MRVAALAVLCLLSTVAHAARDAGPTSSGGSDASEAEVAASDVEAARRTAEAAERAAEAAKKKAQHAWREAEDARREAEDVERAVEERRRAHDALASRIADIERDYEAYEKRTTRLYQQLARQREAFARVFADIVDGPPVSGVTDPRFEALSASLATARRSALEGIRESVGKPEALAAPPRISESNRAIIGDQSARAIAAVVDELATSRKALLDDRQLAIAELGEVYNIDADVLTAALVYALRHSSALDANLRSLRAETGVELGGEAVHVVVRLSYWARARLGLLIDLPNRVTYDAVASLLWDLSKFVFLLLLLAFAMRRWVAWMNQAIEIAGTTLTYGRFAILLVRLLEAAKRFGPPLLTLLAALSAYRLFPAHTPETELALQLIITVSAFRVQLRLVEAATDSLESRRIEREQERALLAAEETDPADSTELDDVAAATETIPTPPPKDDVGTDLEPFWVLFLKSWRRLTRYLAVVVVLLVVANFAIGRGVFYGVTIRWAWIGAIPLTLLFLRTWRAKIVHELTVRAKNGDSQTLLGRLARRHSNRIYGLPIVFAAFVVVIGRRSAAFVKRHFFELNSTKRALAFLFRRSVQKHARQKGRVLEKPTPLPRAITKQFSKLEAPEMVPVIEPLLKEILASLKSWEEDGVDGSVALIGQSGMGKSPVLKRFAEEMSSEHDAVLVTATLEEKITRPSRLVRWLAEQLDLDESPSSERLLVSALRAGPRRIVAIDNCHHLFLRQVGGFEAWEAFVRIINDCGSHVFWLVSCGKAAWDYLANVSGQVSYFRKVLHMPAWSETDLRRLILGRMRRSGYKVNFNDLLVTRLEGVKMTSQIIRTSQGYFRLLWDYAKGNPTLASYFWLRSLVPEEQGRSVRVNLFAAPRIEELEKLPDDLAFVLTAVFEHESASAHELATITSLPLELCRFAVRFCKERGYLERRENRVVISRLWRQTIATYLKRKHLLYS